MATIDLYSKRNGRNCDTFIYDNIPDKLRIQIIHIVFDFVEKNNFKEFAEGSFWKFLYETLVREHGKTELSPSGLFNRNLSYSSQVQDYILYEKNIDYVIDTIELLFHCIAKIHVFLSDIGYDDSAYPNDEAILDLNTRFKENCIGYKFENNMIIRTDNEFLYQQITKPTIKLLIDNEFNVETINEEYMKALEHFRHNNFKESINECLKAFESTLKIICHKKGWKFDQRDGASKLIGILFSNDFIPTYLQNEFSALRSILADGISTIRNKTSAHGAGVNPITVEANLVSYTINLTGSAIVFLFGNLQK